MKNSEMPASVLKSSNGALWNLRDGHEDGEYIGQKGQQFSFGITKRELFCLYMAVAETGDAELDAIIEKGNRQKFAAMAMEGFLSCGVDYTMYSGDDIVEAAVIHAKKLMTELRK